MRFYPRKRIAIDGRLWWCVFDETTKDWSTYLCFTKYRRKKDAQYAISRFSVEWNLKD